MNIYLPFKYQCNYMCKVSGTPLVHNNVKLSFYKSEF